MYIFVYIHIYIYVCVVCVYSMVMNLYTLARCLNTRLLARCDVLIVSLG